MRRVVPLLALVLAAVLGPGAATALAHNTLVGSDPGEGARLDTAPGQVRLTFDQPVRVGFNTVTMVGPDGAHWIDAEPQVEGSSVTAPVGELGPAGTYTVGYRILSADGHPVPGKVTFELTQPGNGSPVPAPAGAEQPTNPDDAAADSGAPVWPWVAGAGVLVLLGLGLALRLGKPTS
ncbi:copper resistance protein CopC [Allosaccharopolyspora coralli]|uniref:Copper resistance protein CopC n=1 Tax=Allosaccharopolyspora coralli TaxID=2665642 RepID=A0A5Q3Q343_9PSEU|nr:copper resistance CopC family protein [Allosaccharopolyspora coralli]QGK68220.1 copper resistance protein CopC [Allosaccharopolyspora coralli]